MQGLGNDYVYVDCFRQPPPADPVELARRVSDRHFGIGSDGLILILPGERAPVRMRMFNADGSEGEMCGNGVRCLARYVHESGYVRERVFGVETLAGVVEVEVLPPGDGPQRVRVDMGRPRFRRADIPMSGPPEEEARDLELDVGGHVFRGTAVSVGNPHFVILTQDVESVDVPLWGPRLERHPVFPQRANVEFVQVLGPSEVRMRVWERGSGITLACGTGACAAAVVAAASGRTGRRVVVHLDGGDLEVEWRDDDHVTLTGPVVEVFRGVYDPR